MSAASRDRPLGDMRVLDLSRVVAGPFAGRILADLGADVVKLEPPAGDATRLYGQRRGALSGQFVQQNVGKRNICVDLKCPSGAELVRRLAGQADVAIENFRPGVMERLGLGWEGLVRRNPRLVLLSVTGFGQTGPGTGRRSYAPVIHAETGLIARQAHVDERAPSDPMPSIADTNASLHGVIATLAALHLREVTGRGQHIDIAMTDALLATDDYVHHALDREPIVRVGGDIWKTAWGEPILTAGLFSRVSAQLHGLYDLGEGVGADMEGAEESQRSAVQEWMMSWPDKGSLVEGLERAGVAWADVREPMEVFEAPWAKARGLSARVDDRFGRERLVVETPYRFSDARAGVRGRIAHRGEDNGEVLREWLGLSREEIARLTRDAVLLVDEYVTSEALVCHGDAPGEFHE